jgi:hypothetical protein
MSESQDVFLKKYADILAYQVVTQSVLEKLHANRH